MNPTPDLPAVRLAENPAPILEDVFRRIEQERMQGIPILNRALRVEGVGFQEWEGKWVGVLLTPWFMNFMVLPMPGTAWPRVERGNTHPWHLPLGRMDCMAGYEEEFGDYHMCSLFSPVLQFEDHEAARIAAQAALDAILGPPKSEESPPGPVRKLAENAVKPMSKRDFLTGKLFRESGR